MAWDCAMARRADLESLLSWLQADRGKKSASVAADKSNLSERLGRICHLIGRPKV